MEGTILRTISIDGRPVIVIKRKSRKVKAIPALLREMEKFSDPSHESEKPKNPLSFTRTSFAKGFKTKRLWSDIRLPLNHVKSLFGEPTRVCSDRIEWVIKLRSNEILKIVTNNRGIDIYGFNRTEFVEKFVNRLLNS